MADRVVFDTEPLLAHAWAEPGHEAARARLDDVYDGHVDGYLCTVNAAEVRYLLCHSNDPADADRFLEALRGYGIAFVDLGERWVEASSIKYRCRCSLADACASAVAADLSATLVVGADDDYDAIAAELAVPVERVRTGPG